MKLISPAEPWARRGEVRAAGGDSQAETHVVSPHRLASALSEESARGNPPEFQIPDNVGRGREGEGREPPGEGVLGALSFFPGNSNTNHELNSKFDNKRSVPSEKTAASMVGRSRVEQQQISERAGRPGACPGRLRLGLLHGLAPRGQPSGQSNVAGCCCPDPGGNCSQPAQLNLERRAAGRLWSFAPLRDTSQGRRVQILGLRTSPWTSEVIQGMGADGSFC